MDKKIKLDRFVKLAKKLSRDLLVYYDEKLNLSFCVLTHSYKPMRYYIATVKKNGEIKYIN